MFYYGRECFNSVLYPRDVAGAPWAAEELLQEEGMGRQAGSAARGSPGLSLVSLSLRLPVKISIQFQKFKK